MWTLATLGFATVSIFLGKRYSTAYPVAMMAVLMAVGTILANKLVVFGPFVVSGGILVYSATFLITDLISEIWGKELAKTAVWAGFCGSVFLLITLWFTIMWPAPEFAYAQAENFANALSLTGRVVAGSLVAYLLAQHVDVWIFHKLRQLTNQKHLWIRNNASTLVSQFLDTIIFVTIAFYGLFPIVPLLVGGYIAKVAIALIDTPFIYGIKYLVSKIKSV